MSDKKQKKRYKRMIQLGHTAIPLVAIAVALMLFTAIHPRMPAPMRIMAGSAVLAVFPLGWKMCSALAVFENTVAMEAEDDEKHQNTQDAS
jgi:hypothetical protein